MNRSKIEWCDHTWNPITGCRHGCKYCYANHMVKRFAGDTRLNIMAKKDYRMEASHDGSEDVYVLDEPMLNETGKPLVYPFGFEPTFHRHRLNTLDKLKMGNNVFVGAMADIFGEWIPDEWIREVLEICLEKPQNNYLFLTKNPERYVELCLKEELPEGKNMWYGITVTNARQAHVAETTIQDMPARAHAFLSVEPILEDVSEDLEIIIANFADWIIIGAETGRRKGKVTPRREWIENIVEQCDKYATPVFMKDSLIPVMGEENMRRDFPDQLKHKAVSKKMEKKLYGQCCSCKGRLKKSEMITLLARSKRGEQPKQFGFMCKQCFKEFCNEKGLNIPALANFAGDVDSITLGPGEDEKDE